MHFNILLTKDLFKLWNMYIFQNIKYKKIVEVKV